jgi:hypothetical protein
MNAAYLSAIVSCNLGFESVKRESSSNMHACAMCDPPCFVTRNREVRQKSEKLVEELYCFK